MRSKFSRYEGLLNSLKVFFIFPLFLFCLDFREFLPPNSTIFDVGASVGEKTEIYLSLGAKRVISIEPNRVALTFLHAAFDADKRVIICPLGLSHSQGVIPFYPARNPALSSATPDWKTGRFKNEIWEPETTISVTTLDELIRYYGVPDFCKIDVEGYEFNILMGLSCQIPLISFEFAYEFLETKSKACFERLLDLGYKRFNVALGGLDVFVFDQWVDWETVYNFLLNSPDPEAWGDIYAISKRDCL